MIVSPFLGGTLLSIVEVVGNYALKRYALGSGLSFLGLGTGVYLSLVGILIWLFRSHGLALINAYWDGTSNIISMVVAACFLNEVYSLKQWIGMIITGFGIFLLKN